MLSKSQRQKLRKASKKKGATPSDDGIPTATVNRRLGSLVLNEAQKALAEKKKQVSAIEREKAYKVIIDLENVRREFPKDFDAQTLKGRFEALIKNGNEGAFIYGGNLVSVGNMQGFLNVGRHTKWEGVSVHHIFPRDSRCKKCGKLIQWSDNYNRTTCT